MSNLWPAIALKHIAHVQHYIESIGELSSFIHQRIKRLKKSLYMAVKMKQTRGVVGPRYLLSRMFTEM